MMTRTGIMNELEKRGMKVEVQNTVKNGVIFEGILVHGEGAISPVIYTNGLIEEAEKTGKTVEDVANKVIEIFEESRGGVKLDLENLKSKEWIMEHLNIGVQKVSDENMIKKDLEKYLGMEAYLYIKGEDGDAGYSIKVNYSILISCNLCEEEAWDIAYKNVCKATQIKSMKQILSEMMGLPIAEEEEEDGMYVISNIDRVKGASAILNEEKLKEFAKKQGVSRIFILPSSIHECILVPDKGGFALEDLSNMVKEVNENEVAPEERLPDKAYVVSF